jgi:ABC-type sugar transport system ATPase subunit
VLRIEGITKRFPGVLSLDAVGFDVAAGEVHALVGENGAGKSTLIKVIAGAYLPDAGTIEFAGERRVWASPQAARAAGIHVIYQELVLFPELTVAENVMIGDAPRTRLGLIDHRAMRRRATEVLAGLGIALDPRTSVKHLSVADQQMLEIAKALIGDARLLILDEPTAVISGREAELLFERMRRLRARGTAIIYISHRLEEVFRVADRVTVLKDGRRVGTWPLAAIDRARLVASMVGRELAAIYPAKAAAVERSRPVLEVEGLSAGGRVQGVSFRLYPGEVLGIAGLVGAGRTILAHALFGSLPWTSGVARLDGAPYRPATPGDAIARGVAFLTEDRRAEGLLLNLQVAPNITPPALAEVTNGLLLDSRAEQKIAEQEITRYAIAARSPKAEVVTLSGGNQQKILFSRWARACHKVLILDEPTRGVDVGAKVEIYRIIRGLAEQGIGVIMISSELPEIIGVCDRVVVMREGMVSGELTGAEATEEAIMGLATAHPASAREAAA